MFLIFLLIVGPKFPEYRTKIRNFEENIKAYSLLERKKKQENQVVKKLTQKAVFIEPELKNVLEIYTCETLLKALFFNGEKIYYNECGKCFEVRKKVQKNQ